MEKLAIIGTGIAGMGCAHFLNSDYDLTIYEKNDYVGGHTNTITVDEEGQDVFVDTGFMVFNHVTYPLLTRLFEELGVPTKKTDMSFSVQHLPSSLEYCGSGLNGLFAQRKNFLNPRYIRMLMQIGRFNKESLKTLDDPKYDDYSLGRFVKEEGYGEDMLWKYIIPMSSAVWSTPMDLMLDFPVKTLVRFFFNHGFLGLNTQHQWYTVVNGSKSYRDILIAPFKDKIEVNNSIVKVVREDNKVSVHTKNGSSQVFDKVIIAAHADEALAMLGDPTADEKNLLSKFKYQRNVATLHTDEGIMPKLRSTWSSWNYRIEEKAKDVFPSTIYWMNSLQGVSKKKNYFVSINDPGIIDQRKIIRTIDYTHPLFDVPAVKAQNELSKLNHSGPIYYCGSYFRYGFHEDAFASAVALCRALTGKRIYE